MPAYADAMRWDALFEDMEAQLASERLLGLESEISERARVEIAGIDVSDRLRGAIGRKIDVKLRSGTQVSGTLSHVGSESVVLDEGRHQWLVPVAAALAYQGLAGRSGLANRRHHSGLAWPAHCECWPVTGRNWRFICLSWRRRSGRCGASLIAWARTTLISR
ncbi:hypothetical protein AHiyo8_55050 [Arthrobacter sp. Hiyo8]|nr:hypothetical protein AHiyo8_55050 [Arthrobacter sp. Hiyo8]